MKSLLLDNGIDEPTDISVLRITNAEDTVVQENRTSLWRQRWNTQTKLLERMSAKLRPNTRGRSRNENEMR